MRPIIGFWKSGGATPPPPILECVAAQSWPNSVLGLPYVNSGNTTTGLTDICGEGLPAVVSGELAYGFPANADPDPSSGTFRRSGFKFPVVAGNFDLQFEFRLTDTFYDYQFFILFYALTNHGFRFGGGAWTVTTGGLVAAWQCNVVDQTGDTNGLPFDPALPNSGLLNDTLWHTFRLVRSGSTFTIFVDDIEFGAWDSESLVLGNLGLTVRGRTWDSQTPTFNVRNISIAEV